MWKRYGDRNVVPGVSIAIASGELIGLVGPNGSGKTTTIRMLLDIIPADHGRVWLFGGPMSQAAQSRIGYLPEERGFRAYLLMYGQRPGIRQIFRTLRAG